MTMTKNKLIFSLALASLLSVFSYKASAVEYALPLAPPERHSPRQTMTSFATNINMAYRLIKEANKENDAAGAVFFNTPEALAKAEEASIYFKKAIECLDLRDTPSVYRNKIGSERALQLKEIMDRVPIPASRDIPGTSDLITDEGHMETWRIPGTEIRLRRLDSGEEKGYYLFSSESLKEISDFYEAVQNMPYRDDPLSTPGFWDWYNDSPGHLLPPRWAFLLPKWSMVTVESNTIWQWMALFILIGITLLAISLAMGFFRNKSLKNESDFKKGVLKLCFTVTSIAIAAASRYLIKDVINLSGSVALLFSVGTLSAFIWIFGAWTLFGACSLVADIVIMSPKVDPNSVDASLLRTVSRLIGIFAALSLLTYGASQLGIPLASVITGLGVAGLAISLAAKPTIENIIGGISLFADKPVKVGDFCQFGDNSGTVVEIGIRSTRLRLVDRTILSVPNADFSQLHMMNLSRRDRLLFETTVGLRYETSMDQLRWTITKIKEMLLSHPKVHHGAPVRVRFSGFGAYSLDVVVRAFIQTRDWETFLAIKEDLLFRMAEIVDSSGSGFAFPSNTAYLAEDTPPDKDRGARAEKEVEEWRKSGKLPFPNPSPDLMKEIRNSLDYPPRGSFEADRD